MGGREVFVTGGGGLGWKERPHQEGLLRPPSVGIRETGYNSNNDSPVATAATDLGLPVGQTHSEHCRQTFLSLPLGRYDYCHLYFVERSRHR